MRLEHTQYGFDWGPVQIERWCSDEKKGWVVMGIKTPKYKTGLQIYVTKTGKIRIYDGGKEWHNPATNG